MRMWARVTRFRPPWVSVASAVAVILLYLYVQHQAALPSPPVPRLRPAPLDRPIPELQFTGKLADAVTAIEKASGQRIWAAWDALENPGDILDGPHPDVSREDLVELHLHNVTVGQALWALGRQGLRGAAVGATSDGALRISMFQAMAGPPTFQVHDARALRDDARAWARLVTELTGTPRPSDASSGPHQQVSLRQAHEWAMAAGNINAARLYPYWYPNHLQELPVDDAGAWEITTQGMGAAEYHRARPLSDDEWLAAAARACLEPYDRRRRDNHAVDARIVVVGTREEHRRIARLLAALASGNSDAGTRDGERP